METKFKTIEAPEIKRGCFISNVFTTLGSLWKGMKVTLYYFTHPSTVVTQQYPENRNTLKMMERFRSQLIMVHDENGHHTCTACGICEQNCPNASITVLGRKNPVSGKKELDRYIWRMDSCTFCNLCVQVCPFGTLEMAGNFEAATYDRRLFVYTLNRYAGPDQKNLLKIENLEDRKKQMEGRDIFGGPVPLSGHSIAGLQAGVFEQLRKPEEVVTNG